MKVAHFSDLHLLSLEGVPRRRFFNKRITGYLNLRLKRESVHRASYVRAIAREIARQSFDHVVVTGDLTNLSLEPEFALAREVLERDLAMDPARVTVVPGNHDVYTRGAKRSGRFEQYLAPWLAGDREASEGDPFPVLKIAGPIAIIGMTSAVPRAPFVAAGEVGAAQLARLERLLDLPAVRDRAVVLAIHHPPLLRAASRIKGYLEGLRDGPQLLAAMRRLRDPLVVHGHLHRRVERSLSGDGHAAVQIGATSASLHHAAPDRMAGFNVYEFDSSGRLLSIRAHVYSPDSGSFFAENIPHQA